MKPISDDDFNTVLEWLHRFVVPDPTDDIQKQGIRTVEDLMKYHGWELLDKDDNGYHGIARNCCDDIDDTVLRAIAPYVKDGSWIQMVGEDFAVWRYYFIGGELKWREPHFTFENAFNDDASVLDAQRITDSFCVSRALMAALDIEDYIAESYSEVPDVKTLKEMGVELAEKRKVLIDDFIKHNEEWQNALLETVSKHMK